MYQRFLACRGTMRCCLYAAMALGLTAVSGCETDAQTGTLIGAGIGAVAGQAIGGDTEGTLIGAGAGAVGGYLIGNESDKKKDDYDYQADSR